MRELSALESAEVAGGGETQFTFGNYVLTVNDAQVACTLGGAAAGVIVSDAGGGFIAVQVAGKTTTLMCDKMNNADWSFRDSNNNTPLDNAANYVSAVAGEVGDVVGSFISGLLSAIQNAASPKPPRDPDAQGVHPKVGGALMT